MTNTVQPKVILVTLYSIDTCFYTSTINFFWKHCGKGEIARNNQFLLFPECFLLKQITVYPFVNIFTIISLFAAELEEPRIGISDKGLNEAECHFTIVNLKEEKNPSLLLV